MEEQIVEPDAGRMIEGLRDTGYEFETAMADIVDNSLAARATRVDILLLQDIAGDVTVSVADNGIGMDRHGLLNAMRYGSRRRGDASSLGKFGLGLKTASTAFCRRLSVTSRPSGEAPLLTATWDLDRVHSEQAWKLQWDEDVDEEVGEQLDVVAPDSSGTVVRWQKVDRLLRQYAVAGGRAAQNALIRTEERLREHLGKVYQRFLDHGDDRVALSVVMTLNGKPVDAWDPFVLGRSELLAESSPDVELADGGSASFRIRAFALPRKDEFPDEESFRRAKLENDRQGIYVYRENRLIHDADWLGMFSKEPHGSLLRVEFSFDHRLDDAFKVDVKKSRILLDPGLYAYVREQFLTGPRRDADRRYRDGQKRKIGEKSGGAHTPSNRNIGEKAEQVGAAQVTVTDPAKNEVTVTNSGGVFKLKMPVTSAERPGEVSVRTTDQMPDGFLYRPCIIDGHKAVEISTSHPFYSRVYLPNLERSTTVSGLDALLWALCVAEYTVASADVMRDFEELRYTVSRMLRKLVESLPEPSEGDLS